MKKQNVRTTILLVATSAYLLIGAAIFDNIESKNEMEEREELNNTEYEIVVKYNMSATDFERLRKNILVSRPYKAGIQWKFGGAFYFALSVITTIGYGHSTPRTMGGKLFCIAYAVIGIPLNIVMFQSIGERFNIFLSYLLGKAKLCFRCRHTSVSQVELILLGTALCILVLVGGAEAFRRFEHWQFVDSLYFCFVTMSTIGFGDFVALQNETTAALQTQPAYVTFCIVYIVCGLTVFAAALNQMVLRLLTLNTEDERKDEIEALEHARQVPRINGDILIANDDKLLQNESSFTLQVDSESYRTNRSESSRSSQLPLTCIANNSQLYVQKNAQEDKGNQLTDRSRSLRMTKFPFTRKNFRLPKLRYSARRRPCDSVRHLLTMQDGVTPSLRRKTGLNSIQPSPILLHRSAENGGSGLAMPSIICIPPPPSSTEETSNSDELDQLILPSPKRFSC